MVVKHDRSYTVHRRYNYPGATAIYSILRSRTGYTLGLVSRPLQELLPSLKPREIYFEVSEAFDVGLMMAEIDDMEKWEGLQDSDFDDMVGILEVTLTFTFGRIAESALSCMKHHLAVLFYNYANCQIWEVYRIRTVGDEG